MKIINFIIIAIIMLSCTKNDTTQPFYDKSKTSFVIAVAIPNQGKPEITFEISDSTFLENNNFTYYLSHEANDLGNYSFDERYVGFAPMNKVFLNPAYLKYDFKESTDLTGTKAYKIKFSGTGSVQTIAYADTSAWIQVAGTQFSSVENTFIIPINDFSYAYFIGKK